MNPLFGNEASIKVIERLEDNGHEAVFVGGAVRDYLLGRAAKDFDIATSAEPSEVKALFSNTVDIGIAHGTVLVIIGKEPLEVTTFRTDGTYSDHRRPDDVLFVKSLREDLLRRDFTINALAMRANGELVDLFGGQRDINKQMIRAVGNPVDRFQEDALRMLRAVRFSSVLDFTIDEGTYQAIRTRASQIRHVSIERVKIEMDKLFVGSNPAQAFNYLENTGLGDALPLFPDKMEALSNCLPFRSSIEGWAYLMLAGGFKPSDVSSAYKLSTKERKIIASIDELFEKRKNGFFERQDLYQFETIILTTTERFFAAFHDKAKTETVSFIEAKKAALPIQSLQELKIDGADLIEWAGCKGGPWTGKWLKKIEQAVLNSVCENESTKIRDWFIHEFRCEE